MLLTHNNKSNDIIATVILTHDCLIVNIYGYIT